MNVARIRSHKRLLRKQMNIQPEFEQEKDGRWVASIPGVREGSTQHEAAVDLTVSALHVLANRIQGGRVKVEDKLPGLRIGISGAADPQFFQRMAELLLELEAATPRMRKHRKIKATPRSQRGG
jgi:hypothetical protein